MKNLVVLEDSAWEFPTELSPLVTLLPHSSTHLVSSAVNVINGEVLLLTNTGILISQSISSETSTGLTHEPWNLNLITENLNDDSWFEVKIIGETGSIVCLSHSGHIVSVASNRLTDEWADVPESEGCVDTGIAAAAWNPDESVLILVTNNDSFLCMTSSFELVSESATIPRTPGSSCLVSWRGDGMQFSMYSVDISDNTAKVRIFNKDLELLFEGRNVGDGAQAVVKSLLPAMAYATNGSLIAVAQQRTPKKQQIVFLERSGLRHGEFDMQEPTPPPEALAGSGACNVVHLAWNIETTILAVVLEHVDSNKSTEDSNLAPYRTVQLYHRNNYYWYLKQQWSGEGLRFLGFDVEVPDRLYMSEKKSCNSHSGESSGVSLRVVNMIWDTCVSLTSDCSCVVMDGKQLKVTPLGKAVIPPPMSKYQLDLPAACQHVSFGSAAHGTSWILAALCDEYFIRLFHHTDTLCDVVPDATILSTHPREFEDINLRTLGGDAMSNFQIRGVQPVVCKDAGKLFLVVVCVASAAQHSLESDSSGQDNILVIWRPVTGDGNVNWTLDSYPIQDGGKAQRLVPWATDTNSVGVGIMTHGIVPAFNITKIDFFFNENQQHIDVKFSTEFVFSENCSRQLSVIKLDQALSHTEALSKTQDDEDEGPKYLYAGLSAAPHTSRLYVNDNLLSSAHVSSFAVNPALGVLMFVTASAKPLLQFTSLESLYDVVNGAIEANLLLYENNVNDAPTNYNATTSFAKRNNDANKSTNVQDNSFSVVTFALPRPVERGTRLIGTPNGSALVVLQMPRGNLEGCEPRPLVLMKSRMLLSDCKYFECLLLLRRQRVDMNLLVDHDPLKFLANVNDFVNCILEHNPEFLSLLITALEVGNVCFEKYPIPSLYTASPLLGQTVAEAPTDSAITDSNVNVCTFQWDDKVNVICKHLRNALFSYINSHSTKHSGNFNEAVLPLLCTYAKQQPPQLSEALFLVKRCALGLSVSPKASQADIVQAEALSDTQVSHALNNPTSQKCLKYIAFLCDYGDLFRAALAECDFDMARAIARQGGQLDPKEYLPMLESLQSFHPEDNSVGDSKKGKHILDVQDSSTTCEYASSAAYCLMRFNVYVHLEMYSQALAWALQCIGVISAPQCTTPLDAANEKLLLGSILSIVTTHHLHTICIPGLRSLRTSITAAASSSGGSGARRPVMSLNDIAARKANKGKGVKIVSALLSKVLYSFGEHCHKQGHYDEAVSAFLSSSEPDAPRSAIHAAIVNGNWHEAIAIGGRYYVEGDDENDEFDDELDPYSSNKVSSLNPRRIAQGIIEDYKSSLEQGLGGIESNEYISVFCSTTQKSAVSDISPSEETGESQAISIATLCLEYFNDIEGAVTILLLAKAWRAAAHMASRHRRSDLLTEDVGGALRFEAKAMIRLLPERTAKQTELVEKLNDLWRDPATRLEAVSGVDAGLLAALRGEEEAAEDTRSDFGGGMSVYSNLSLASNMSNLSSASSASNTLSMLSDSLMSQTSAMSQASGVGYYSSRKPSSSSFSVVGLEHNLLSRGNGDSSDMGDSNDGEFHPHETNKQKRLRKKKEMKGRKQTRERDVFGLKSEASMSKELYELGDVSSVATSVSTVCSVLLLVGGAENQLLACQLQASMDAYTSTIAAQTAPSAPLYPLEWLRRREMEEVRWFQASPENANPLLTHVAEGVWWRRSVRGLALWNKIKKKTLLMEA